MTPKLWLAAACLSVATAAAMAAPPQRLEIDSLDLSDGVGSAALRQPAFWFRTERSGPAPAVLLLHGCGGPYGRSGALSARMTDYAALLNAEGLHVLVTDSLTPRGERELCTQKVGTRKVTQLNRRRDALGALQWLAAQPEVDATHIGLMGWSNGGSNVLAATNLVHAEVRAAAARPAFAVAFYPGCEDELRRGYRPSAPLLMLLGGADDWTAPGPCVALAQASSSADASVPPPEAVVYPGAYHGFDGTAAVVVRRDVPNGVRGGLGVHVGTDPAARAASHERLLQFLRLQVSR